MAVLVAHFVAGQVFVSEAEGQSAWVAESGCPIAGGVGVRYPVARGAELCLQVAWLPGSVVPAWPQVFVWHRAVLERAYPAEALAVRRIARGVG